MSRLRVTGGDSKGRRLRMPKSIRPTQGLVKQAIFNIVAARIEDSRVVDLFAGSGALGIEALSRGAALRTAAINDIAFDVGGQAPSPVLFSFHAIASR